MSQFDPTSSESQHLPEGLRKALVGLHEPGVTVPGEIDLAVLREARAGFGRRRRLWIGTRWAAAVLAAAAMVVIAVRLFDDGPRSQGGSGGERPQLAKLADVNHDSRVNILDAYVVARHIARHEPLDAAWDVNGDGVVDQKDVDLIAAMAVKVSDGEQAR